NTKGLLSDRSMHSQSSLLQLFFTSKLPDIEAVNGIVHPPPRAGIMYRPHPISLWRNPENRHAGILVIRALGAFRRFRDRSSHQRTQKERHPDQAPEPA